MCGICGIYNLNGNPVDSRLLECMNDTMVHRGPDGSGIFIASNIGLGHRRLSIIDLESGKQPMGSENGSIQVVFNGEIYNFLELRKFLEGKGHRFSTHSDTESIIHGYEEWGEDFVEKLRGMFSIALWDAPKQKLMLIRDRIGKKPLFYSLNKGRLSFASELKSLLADDSIPRTIDHEALDCYMSYGYVPSPLSIFKSIKKLPPAHLAVCTPENFFIREYWRLNMGIEPSIRNEEEAAQQLCSIFDESVKIRLISDVPLGAFLSGGIDSSLVVASMAKLMDTEPVKTTSIGFTNGKFNELEFSRIMADHCRTDHTEFIVDPDAISVLNDIAWHLDEPFADASAIPTFYVSKMARQKVTVALSGDGGDETFAGYIQRYSMNRFEDGIRKKLPSPVRAIAGWISNIYPRTRMLPRALRLKSFLSNISKSLEEAYFRDMSFYFAPDMKQSLYLPDFAAAIRDSDPFRFLKMHFVSNQNPDVTTRIQYVDIKTYLPEDILVKVDRMSMAHSLEVRSPLLDHKLIEFAGTLNSSLKLNGGNSKYILKKSMENRLPKEILSRKKQGFSVPLASWLRGELSDFAQQTIFSSNAISKDYFNQSYIHKLWDSHANGLQDNASSLWALIMFELWYRRFCS
jgi:asparagine synthase (glutamine-hydrolysing)